MTRREVLALSYESGSVTHGWVFATPNPEPDGSGFRRLRGGRTIRVTESPTMRRISVAVTLALILAGCSDSGNGAKTLDTLHRDSFEAIIGTWPLTVESATPVCGNYPGAIGVKVGDTTYALNGTAQAHEGWADLHAIWAPNPDISGAYLNDGDLIHFVAERC